MSINTFVSVCVFSCCFVSLIQCDSVVQKVNQRTSRSELYDSSDEAVVYDVTDSRNSSRLADNDRLRYHKVSSDGYTYKVQGPHATAADRMTNSSLEWLLNLYNPHLFGESLIADVDNKCREQMNVYLRALQKGDSWAAKSK